MAGPKVPDGWEIEGQPLASAKTAPKVPDGWELDAPVPQARTSPAADPGSPLERALAAQSGDVVTVETPTGPAKFTRSGERFYDAEESAQFQESADARLKERALEGVLSFLSGGGPLLDELAGAGRALSVDALGKSKLDEYRKGRDQARRAVDASTRHASPDVEVAGVKIPVLPMLGSAVPSLMAPNPAGPGARILSAVAQGAANAGASSTADLTRGETSDFARDVGTGAGTSLLASGVAEGVAAPFRAIGRGAATQAQAADDAAQAAIQAARDKAVKSATSSLGGVSMGQMASVKNAIQVLEHPQLYPPAALAEAKRLLTSPEGQSLMAQAAANNAEKFFEGVPREAAARLALSEAQSAAQPGAVSAVAAAQREPLALLGDLAKKGWRSVGQRAAMGAAGSALGAGVSAARGGDARDGAMIGALGGVATPGTLQFLRNQAASPVVQGGANRLTAALMKATERGVTSAGPLVAPVADQRVRARLSAGYAAMLRQYGLGGEQQP